MQKYYRNKERPKRRIKKEEMKKFCATSAGNTQFCRLTWNVFAGRQSPAKAWRSIISFFSFFFFHKPTIKSVRSYRYTGEKLSCLVSIELLEFFTPLKICFTYDGPYEQCKK